MFVFPFPVGGLVSSLCHFALFFGTAKVNIKTGMAKYFEEKYKRGLEL
jgi:hypothetical protein